MSKYSWEIQHPEWLADSRVESTMQLYRDGKIPKCIAAFVLSTALKHDLRAIYGSNLRSGLAIVYDALVDEITNLRYRLGLLTPTEREWEKEFDALDREDLEKEQNGLREH